MINICFAADEHYLQYMATAMVSLLKNASTEDELHFYILCNQISDSSKEYIKSLKNFKDFDIDFLDMDIKEFEEFPSGGSHISNTTYFRYKIAELCPNIDKIIYIDCDVIVKTSISELFEVDLTGYWIGGVEDIGYYYWRTVDDSFYIYKTGFYINAGMLLINLDEWRKNDLFHKFIDYTIKNADKIKIGDQDVINQVCIEKIKELDYKWNVQDSFYRAKPERAFNPNCQKIIYASKHPAIIHYTCIKKPWNDYTMPKAFEWVYYDFIRTGSYKICLNYCYIKIKDTIIHDILQNIFSVKNDGAHKILRILGIKMKFRRKNAKR